MNTFQDFFNNRDVKHLGAKGRQGDGKTPQENVSLMIEEINNGKKKKRIEQVEGRIKIGKEWKKHTWILLNNVPYDPTYGNNKKYEYKGKVVTP